MSYQFRPCHFEMDQEAYMNFLLQHHAELNLSYSFALKLSFISSPLVLGNALLILDEECYELVGTAGFVYGTGVNNFEDKQICQIEVAFIQQAYRGTFVFVRGLQALVELIKAANPQVEQVQFWVPCNLKQLDRLLVKFDALPGSTKTTVNNLLLYTIPFIELERYCRRFRAPKAYNSQLHNRTDNTCSLSEDPL